MGFDIDLAGLLRVVVERWYQRSTIALLVAVVLLGGLLFLSGIDVGEISWVEWILLAAAILVLLISWRVTTSVPKAAEESVGLAVAISAVSREQRERIADDFVEALRNLLSRGKLRYRFSLIELPQYHAGKINSPEDARRYLQATRCRFLVYGRARERRIQGEDHHVLDLEGTVLHREVPEETRHKFSTEFAELFPRRVLMTVEDDLFKFEFTSRLVDLVARYIIGIASLISGDLDYAESLFENLEERLESLENGNPPVDKIRERLPVRLVEVHFAQARRAYKEWRRTRKAEFLAVMKAHLDRVEGLSPDLYPAHLLRSIWLFVAERDVEGAIKETLKCRGMRDDITWRYNYAFLLCYRGRFDRAVRNYRKAAKGYCDARAMLEMEEFICWVLEEEPEKVHLHFCLGMLNFFGKGDDKRALRDLGRFVELASEGSFAEQVELAEAWIATIGGRLGQEGLE